MLNINIEENNSQVNLTKKSAIAYMKIGDKILMLRKSKNWKQSDLAQKIGVSKAAVSLWEKNNYEPSLEHAISMANLFDIEDPFYFKDKLDFKNKQIDNIKGIVNKNLRKVPVLQWEDLKKHKDTEAMLQVCTNENSSFIYINNNISNLSYALPIKGDAMYSPRTSKSFEAGSMIVIDAEEPLKDGRFVIASIKDKSEPVFRKYLVDGGTAYLKPLNPDYDIIVVDESVEILGVAVATYSEI